MSLKNCYTKHFRREMYSLQHEFISDFYISCWQKNRSILPLFCVRALLFLGCLAILITSMVMWHLGSFGDYFLYVTNWGLIAITLTTGSAFAVSATAYYRGSIEGTFGLPWYVQMYWVLFNTTTPIAFFVTIFYFSLLTDLEDIDYAVSDTLDIFIHGVNSIIMFILVMISRHPIRLQHFYQPLILGVIYLIFNIVYFYAGGLSPTGDDWIYPVLDWNNPGMTSIAVVASAVAIVVLHIVVFALAKLRDLLSMKYTRSSQSISIVNQ